jgi:hypothetical protein
MCVLRNIEARLCNRCCSGKTVSITYSECVFVVLVVQNSVCIRRITLSSVACLWPVCGLSVACMWPVCGLSVACLWPVCGLSVACLWPICGLSVACLWPVSLYHNFPISS